MKSLPPHQILFSFLLVVSTLEYTLYLVFQMISYKVERWLNHLLAIRHNVYSLNDFGNETWNVGCTFTLGDNSNLYMSLNTRSTIGNKHANLYMNFGVRPLGIMKSSHSTTPFGPPHTPRRIFQDWLTFRSVFGFFQQILHQDLFTLLSQVLNILVEI